LSKENNFTLLRLILALLVVISHCLYYQVNIDPFKNITGIELGAHAVFMFFTVSGFLVSSSLDSRGIKDYIIARLLRIYPALIFLTLLIAFVLGPIFTTLTPSEYFSDKELYVFIQKTILNFKSLTALPGLFEGPIGTVWTLRWEMMFYAFLLLLAVTRIFRPKVILGIFIISTLGMFAAAFHYDPEIKIVMTMRLLAAFFLGATLYHYRHLDPLRWPVWLAALPLIWLASGTFMLLPLLVLLEGYFAILFALKPLKKINLRHDVSYGIYLSGWFPIKTYMLLFPDASKLELTFASCLIAICYGYFSWFLIEKPALGLKKGLIKDKNHF